MNCKKLKALIKDEKMAVTDYNRLGLPTLAKDEKKHKLYLEAMLKKKKCR
jgi:hypothetical protein